MQQLEDALNIALCGHFLIILATLCMAAFSVVAVKCKKFSKTEKSVTLKDNRLLCYDTVQSSKSLST
jgi:hypothetical protein